MFPRYETSRGPGSTAEVDFWTSREIREVVQSHLNYLVADTKQWEQSATYVIDTHILATKGFEPLIEVKTQAALRWVNAVNADGSYGQWHYAVAQKPEEVRKRIEEIVLAA